MALGYRRSPSGCGPLVLSALALGGVALAAGMFLAVGSSEPVLLAVEAARAHPESRALLCEPMERGWLWGGSISVGGGSGQARMSVPVSGSCAAGTLYTDALKERGSWRLEAVVLVLEDGREVDLLGPMVAAP